MIENENIIYSIYKVTNNKNRKIYIGITKKSIEERLEEHIASSTDPFSNRPILNAINKYGKESFSTELIEQINDFNLAYARESELIIQYDSINPEIGYNACISHPIIQHNEETRKRMSQNSKDFQAFLRGKELPSDLEIEALYRSGEEIFEICRKLDISGGCVSRALERLNINRNRFIKIEKIKELLQEGKTIEEIAEFACLKVDKIQKFIDNNRVFIYDITKEQLANEQKIKFRKTFLETFAKKTGFNTYKELEDEAIRLYSLNKRITDIFNNINITPAKAREILVENNIEIRTNSRANTNNKPHILYTVTNNITNFVHIGISVRDIKTINRWLKCDSEPDGSFAKQDVINYGFENFDIKLLNIYKNRETAIYELNKICDFYDKNNIQYRNPLKTVVIRPNHTDERVKELFNLKYTKEQIATELNLKEGYINQILNKLNLEYEKPKKIKKIEKININQVLKYIDEGLTLGEIGEKLNVTARFLSAELREINIFPKEKVDLNRKNKLSAGRKKLYKNWNEQDLNLFENQVKKYHNEGLSIEEISNKFNFKQRDVENIIKKIEKGIKQRKELDLDEVLNMLNSGLLYKDVAEKFEVSIPFVQTFLQRNNAYDPELIKENVRLFNQRRMIAEYEEQLKQRGLTIEELHKAVVDLFINQKKNYNYIRDKFEISTRYITKILSKHKSTNNPTSL